MKESYIKLPNITTSKLQDVVDYLDENNIEYIEEYKRDEEIERLKEQLNDEIDDELKQSEIMVKKQEEIERLKEENTILKQTMSNNSLLINENALLKSIIKEVREYINSLGWNTTIPNIQDNVWKILDKENNNEDN